MPLTKSPSKKALAANLKKELKSGKPKKQALAIALETQRKAKGTPAKAKVKSGRKAKA